MGGFTGGFFGGLTGGSTGRREGWASSWLACGLASGPARGLVSRFQWESRRVCATVVDDDDRDFTILSYLNNNRVSVLIEGNDDLISRSIEEDRVSRFIDEDLRLLIENDNRGIGLGDKDGLSRNSLPIHLNQEASLGLGLGWEWSHGWGHGLEPLEALSYFTGCPISGLAHFGRSRTARFEGLAHFGTCNFGTCDHLGTSDNSRRWESHATRCVGSQEIRSLGLSSGALICESVVVGREPKPVSIIKRGQFTVLVVFVAGFGKFLLFGQSSS